MKVAFKISLALTLFVARANAFSLLGPFEDWMDEAKGFRQPWDIGGPMNIGEGYRWNVPVISYGFERSFLDYFGSNGVAAVEAAMQILSRVPPSSQINLQDYPTQVWRPNYVAQATNLMDLKSTVLSLVLEQMGLARPDRYTFCIRDHQTNWGYEDFYVIQRNFDPVTAQPSPYVNETLYTYYIGQFTSWPNTNNSFWDAIEVAIDPLAELNSSATRLPYRGLYLTNITRDDAGGLRYLINGGRVQFENLLPDVRVANTNATLVVGAYRPGIEKIIFMRHPTGTLTGQFLPFTNRWTDIYYAGDFPAYQEVERVTTRPDIVFTARDLGGRTLWAGTGTTNWSNNADWNGNSGGAGPGVIQPPVVIALNNNGPAYLNYLPSNLDQASGFLVQGWGSFGEATNPVVLYPASQTIFQPTVVRFRLAVGDRTNNFRWILYGAANGRNLLQTSTGLASWTTVVTVTNSGTIFDYDFNAISNEPSRFFRIMPVP